MEKKHFGALTESAAATTTAFAAMRALAVEVADKFRELGDLVERCREDHGMAFDLEVVSYDGDGCDVHNINGEFTVKPYFRCDLLTEDEDEPAQ